MNDEVIAKNTHDYQLVTEKLRMHEAAEILLGGGSWLYDLAEGIFTVSKGWQKLFAVHKSVITMDELWPLAHPDDRPEIEASFSQCIEMGEPYHLIHRIIRQGDGQVRTINSYAEMLEYADDGTPLILYGVVHDITDQVQAEEKLKYLATHDSLTGLPTRSLCMDHISQAIENANRNNCKAAVLFIDLDGFKTINDMLGHDAGDNLLCCAGEQLLEAVRSVDTVARIGGDEFVIILTDVTSRDGVERVAENLINKLSSPFHLSQGEARIGASVGIAFYPDHGRDPEALLKEADKAMYLAKGSGKGQYRFANQSENS